MKLIKPLITVFALLIVTNINAQLKVDAQLKPRFEYRHGFKTLFPGDVDPSAFVSQRSRLNIGYTQEQLMFYLSVQDIRVWGDTPQLNVSGNNGFSLHQAWAQIGLSESIALKLGRQEIVYDDARFFGNVDWAQQGRSHDLAMLKVKDGKFKLDFGLAFNQDGESLVGNILTTNTYKSFQYVWLNNDWDNFSGSFLLLNNGRQYIDADPDNNDTRFSQTAGTHLKFGKGAFNLSSNLFYQFGKDVADNDLSAYLVGLDASYKVSEKVKLGVGLEIQSGNDGEAPSNGENKAFTPFYGTNHKFNGLMDYFFVGNHINNVGLTDIYISSNFKLGEKSNLNVALHNFSASADLIDTDETQLGTELDLVYTQKLQKNVTLKAGYSQMFASDGMEYLKNNFDGNGNNWGWVMVVINPTLFNSATN
jgi:hypothetical protein